MKDIIGVFSLIKAQDLIPFVLLHFTTAIMVVYVALRLFGVRFTWVKLMLAALLYAVAMTLIRKVYTYYEIPLGTHTLFLMVIKATILCTILRLRIYEGILGSIITTLLILAATPAAFQIIKLMNIDFKSFSNNPWLFALIGHVEGIYLIMAVLLLAFSDINIYKLLRWKPYYEKQI